MATRTRPPYPLMTVLLGVILSSMSINLYADINLSAAQSLNFSAPNITPSGSGFNLATPSDAHSATASHGKRCEGYRYQYSALMFLNKQCNRADGQMKLDEFEALYIADCPVNGIMALKATFTAMNNAATATSDTKSEPSAADPTSCDSLITVSDRLIQELKTQQQ